MRCSGPGCFFCPFSVSQQRYSLLLESPIDSVDKVVSADSGAIRDLLVLPPPPPAPEQQPDTSSQSSSSCSPQPSPVPNSNSLITMERQQGVLWKRRDIFKNRWRPRWFVLHPTQGVLTYYLLNTPENTIASMTASPLLEESFQSPRARTTSYDSATSQLSVDYDVVPRGTIDLLGCRVSVNAALSKPDFFAFTIAAANDDVDVHLAAVSAQTRDLWIRRLVIVCNAGRVPPTVLPQTVNHPRVSAVTPAAAAAAALAVRGGTNQVPASAPAAVAATLTPSTSLAAVAAAVGSNWTSASPEPDSLYEHLDPRLAASIREKLKLFLTLCDQHEDLERHGWKKLYDRTVLHNTHRAFRRQLDSSTGRSIVCSTAILNHTPQQVFTLIVDHKRRQEYETNIRCIERLKTSNSHTFLDYYAYNAVWPTKGREFAVVTHWQVVNLSRDGASDNAIAIISFSCNAAEALKQVTPDHVRGILHVSMYLLRPAEENKCHLTRFLSFDLAGGVSQKLSNVILTQQANLPSVLAEYLARHEPIPDNRLLGRFFTNEIMEECVIRNLGSCKNTVRRQLTFAENEDDKTVPSNGDPASECTNSTPSFQVQAFLLLFPLALYHWLSYRSRGRSIRSDDEVEGHVGFAVFLLTAFWSTRQLVLLHLGTILTRSDDPALVGPVTCRFTVDLKGMLRYIKNKQEEIEELQQSNEQVSIIHLVVCAVAKAWAREKELRAQRVAFPYLMIDTIVDVSSNPVDVSVSIDSGVVRTVDKVDSRTVQSVANELASAESSMGQSLKLGQCLILATPDVKDGVNMETDALSFAPNFAVVAVIGGVSVKDDPRRKQQQQLLSISLTISVPHLSNVIGCRRFSEEVQKLLSFPEMCDG